MFIGRTKELSFLEAAYSSKESAFIPIYGRRRVGKSELILKFINNKPAVYYDRPTLVFSGIFIAFVPTLCVGMHPGRSASRVYNRTSHVSK